MASISKFQLKEIKRELWFQLNRVENELSILPAEKRARLVGMLKTKRRLVFLLNLLNKFEQDGYLQLIESQNNSLEVIEDDDGAGACVGQREG